MYYIFYILYNYIFFIHSKLVHYIKKHLINFQIVHITLNIYKSCMVSKANFFFSKWNYIVYILYNYIFYIIQIKLVQYKEIFNKFLNYIHNVKSCTVSKRNKSLYV